jgi:hypothetical protein
MLDFLKPISKREYDVVTFFESPEQDKIQVECNSYSDPGEAVGYSSVGFMYHIILVKNHDEDPDKFTNFDAFDAILACPMTYISQLIPQGWYGIIAKKTTTSQKFIDKSIDNLKKLL